MAAATGTEQTPERLAEGFLAIANANMAQAIRQISVQKGLNPADFTLVCFGGAGGQHACAVADELGMDRVFLHPLAGVLSAYGIGLSDFLVLREQAWKSPSLPEANGRTGRDRRNAGAGGGSSACARKIPAPRSSHSTTILLRYAGTDTALADRIPQFQ